ncbi:MAG: hypothetical protein ABFD91_00435 [Anaerohalosphaeraceae bacterium]
MLKMKYALEPGGAKRLELLWEHNRSKCQLKLDGRDIGTFTDTEQLKAGQDVLLEDGTRLTVQLTGRVKLLPFEVMRDGHPLLSSLPPASKRLSSVWQLMFVIGVVNVIAGLTGARFGPIFREISAAGWASVGIGIVYAVLALFVMRKSKTALWIALGLFGLGTIAFPFLVHMSLWIVVVVMVFRLFLMMVLFNGFAAIDEMKAGDISSVN